MKKSGILNKQLNELIGSLGHMDTIIACDAGLPIPREDQRIDLALVPGTPGLVQVLRALLEELVVEKAVIASETREVSPQLFEDIIQLLEESGIQDIEYIPHIEFKERSVGCKAIVRTGEFIPYANVLLVCGCVF